MTKDNVAQTDAAHASISDECFDFNAAESQFGGGAADGEATPSLNFNPAREDLERMVGYLSSEDTLALPHDQVETWLWNDGHELLRRLFQGYLDERAERELRIDEGVVGADEVCRHTIERAHKRSLVSLFGAVTTSRLAYRARKSKNLYPADATLNLPKEKYSFGLRRMCAIEAARGSFDEAIQAVLRATPVRIGKRQAEELTQSSAEDFVDYYASRPAEQCTTNAVLVGSCDGKGIVVIFKALLAATQKRAKDAEHKLQARLSAGEKRNRKRMAEACAVYDLEPTPRTPADILPVSDDERERVTKAPKAKNKWVMASIVEKAATVISKMFDEMQRRDPDHKRPWLLLVDGNKCQIDAIKAQAKRRDAQVTILLDFVHVVEYLWKAVWCFYAKGDSAAEVWVRDHAKQLLEGNSALVAQAIKRQADKAKLSPSKRKGADACIKYLTNKREYLDYPTALRNGWPIATGVIEGVCRHLIKDRMDITGARWGLESAEAVLKLRALMTNGDFEDYWEYHLAQERRRNHETRYAASGAASSG